MDIRVLGLSLAVFNLGIASDAVGAAIYEYTGNVYSSVLDNLFAPVGQTYFPGMSVSGSFTLASSLSANMPLTDISGNVLSYSFNDGVNTHTDTNSIILGGDRWWCTSCVGPAFNVATDALGNISQWEIATDVGGSLDGCSLGEQRQLIATAFIPGLEYDQGQLEECVPPGFGGRDLGQTRNNSGSWTLIPEPSTALLIGFGLTVLPMCKRSY